MNTKENECINSLRFESEKFSCNSIRETELKRLSENLNAWEDSNTCNILNQKNSESYLKSATESKRAKTPGLPEKFSSTKKSLKKSQLSSRNFPIHNFLSINKHQIFNDSVRYSANKSSRLRKKAKMTDSVKIYQHCTESPDFLSKKRVIIHTILPEKCRISGTVPCNYTFLKNPVRINTKKYFILDASIKDL